MQDCTKELKALQGISFPKWQAIKRCIDIHFSDAQKKNVLELNKDVARSQLVDFDEAELNA